MSDRLGEPEFVGRSRELALLEAGFRDASLGRGRTFTIAGEPGIGKTRLVEELVDRLGAEAAVVLWGRCPETGGAPAYWPWRKALAPLLEQITADATGPAAGHRQIASALALAAPDAGREARSDPDEAHFSLLEAVAALLRSTGAQRPAILVLDDVHWADEASLRLLAHLVRDLRGSRLLVLVTYREPEMGRRARPLGEIARFSRRIDLRGLARDEIGRFVAASGLGEPSQAMLARLHETTDGNPFFLDELIAMLRESGELDVAADAAAGVDLPEGVRAAIQRRLEPLGADDRALLEIAAVVGREFSVDVLQAAMELPPDAVLERLAAAIAAGFVRDEGTLGGFRFAHALVRETLYRDLLPAARVAAHRRVAIALERRLETGMDVPLSTLAHHFFLAVPLGEAQKAAVYAERAGRAAMRQLAWDEAALQYDRALSALGFAGDDPERRIRLLLAHGDALQRAGDVGRAAEVLLRAVRLARERGDAASLAIGAMRYAFARGAFLAADPVVVQSLEAALAAIGTADSALRVYLLGALSAALLFSRERGRCPELCREALAMARRLADPAALTSALMAQHFVLSGSPEIEERLRLADEALSLARRTGRTETEWSAWALRVNDLLERGDVGAAESEVERLAQLAEASRAPIPRWGAFAAQACLALLAGRFADAERCAAEAMAARRRGQDAAVAQIFATQTFFRRLETGAVADQEELMARFARDFPDDRGWRAGLALVLADSGRADEARNVFEEVAAQDFADVAQDPNFLGTMAVLAVVAHRVGDAARARMLYERLLPFARLAVVTFIQPVICLGAVSRYLGLLAVTMQEPALAARHFEDAIAMNTRLGARPYLARTQAEYARLLLAGGAAVDRERAAALVAGARTIANAIGQTRLHEDLALLGAQSPAPAPRNQAAASGEGALLRRDGELWRVAYRDDAFHLKDSRGLHLLATLLRHPGRELHVLELVGGAADAGDRSAVADAAITAGLGDAGEMLDPGARAAYKRRIDDLREELLEAERFNDLGRAERARHEMDFLGAELARGVGLGGRVRRAGSAAERARQNVSRTIAAALKKIAAGSPGLGQHLAATVSTGLFCCYDPSLVPAISWTL